MNKEKVVSIVRKFYGFTQSSLCAVGVVSVALFSCAKEENVEKIKPPTAQFTATVSDDGATVLVNNESIPVGNTTYHWDYGDSTGTSNIEAPPAYTYLADGAYTITLTASNEAGSDTATQAVTIKLPEQLPEYTVDFTFEQNAYTITFNNTSENLESYVWNFGDGAISRLVNPSHTYSRMGRYAVSLTAKNAEGEMMTKTENVALNYRNPVLDTSVPDPTIIRHSDGMFYLYATEDIGNMPIFRSYDLITWEFVGTVFTNQSRPTFEPGGGLWAPDINYINGQYVLYYSMSVWGGGATCGIGRAVADKPEGPFTDLGALFRSSTIDVNNSIDPFYIEDEGKKYLFWGSWFGIWGIELTDDGLNLKDGAVKRQIGGTAYEASYIHKRGNYYYLFASWGSCCEGLNSTYRVVVGRSQSLWGPYLNKSGSQMMNNSHQTVISKNQYFVGTGHNSEIIHDDDGNDWILYHGFRVSDGKGRLLFMDKILWEDDWPTIKGGSPSISAESPVFDWQ